MKIKLTEKQIRLIIESEFNYHQSNHDDLRYGDNGFPLPYISDKLDTLGVSRSTGYLGSGMYFSTFRIGDKQPYYDKYNYFKEDKKELIKVEDKVYRVDFSIYKNLYRVISPKHGETLYYALKGLHLINKSNDTIKKNYTTISVIFDSLNLKLPPFRDFLNMIKQAESDFSTKKDLRSISTRIMEYNGYNGVNVSGINGFDNLKHGSVIYDLSKYGDEFELLDKKSYEKFVNLTYEDEYFLKKIIERKVLTSEQLKNIPDDKLLLFFNNYPYLIKQYDLDEQNENFKNLYFKTLKRKFKNGFIEIDILHEKDRFPYYIEPIIKNNLEFIFNNGFKIQINSYEPHLNKTMSLLEACLRYGSDYQRKELVDKITDENIKLSDKEQKLYDDLKDYI